MALDNNKVVIQPTGTFLRQEFAGNELFSKKVNLQATPTDKDLSGRRGIFLQPDRCNFGGFNYTFK